MCSNQSTVNKTIILLGSREVGKSTILNRYVKNRYQEAYKETIGKSSDIILSLWDTNGDEINKRILPLNIYLNTAAFIIVCSYDQKESFDFLTSLISFLEKILTNKSTNNILKVPILVLVNKCDIRTNRQFKLAEVYKTLEGFVSRIFIYEVSAKDNIKIEYAFNQLIKLTTDKMIWPHNISMETTKHSSNKFANNDSINNCKKSFIIEKGSENQNVKCTRKCCN